MKSQPDLPPAALTPPLSTKSQTFDMVQRTAQLPSFSEDAEITEIKQRI